jgi:D-beta-D-heptose 7-phosphate kinase/D-beta-D-heptose 1-phosphate adenosyltransferase
VDAVVVFDEDTPLNLIAAIEPDVLVKGADYTVATVVGADLVLARGGKIVLADLVPAHSTTETIRRIAAVKEA